jgi:hydroxymethylbilane synthase
LDKDEIVLTALVGTPDGKTMLREEVRGTEPVAVGTDAANRLIKRGAKEIVDKVKEELDN